MDSSGRGTYQPNAPDIGQMSQLDWAAVLEQMGRYVEQAARVAQQAQGSGHQAPYENTRPSQPFDPSVFLSALAGTTTSLSGAAGIPSYQAPRHEQRNAMAVQSSDLAEAAQAAATEAMRAANLATQYVNQVLTGDSPEARRAREMLNSMATEGSRVAANAAPVVGQMAQNAATLAMQYADAWLRQQMQQRARSGSAQSNASANSSVATPPHQSTTPRAFEGQPNSANDPTVGTAPTAQSTTRSATSSIGMTPEEERLARQLLAERERQNAQNTARMSGFVEIAQALANAFPEQTHNGTSQSARDSGTPSAPAPGPASETHRPDAPRPASSAATGVTSPAQRPSALVIKAKYGDDLRRVTVTDPESLDYVALQSLLASLFSIRADLRITYTDADGDVIRIAADGDVKEALAYTAQTSPHVLRLDVSHLQ